MLKTRWIGHNSPFEEVQKMNTPSVFKEKEKLVFPQGNHLVESVLDTPGHRECREFLLEVELRL